MALDPDLLPDEVLTFLRERHLATLTTLRADGSPHVVPVGFAFDPDERVVRVISAGGSQKVRNAERPGARAAVSQVDGGRWLTLEGPVRVERAPDEVQRAEHAYANRYQAPRERSDRVAIVITVDRVMGRGLDSLNRGTNLSRPATTSARDGIFAAAVVSDRRRRSVPRAEGEYPARPVVITLDI